MFRFVLIPVDIKGREPIPPVVNCLSIKRFDQANCFSITLPRCRWVVERSAWRRMILLTMYIGLPGLEPYVSAWWRRLYGRISILSKFHVFFTGSRLQSMMSEMSDHWRRNHWLLHTCLTLAGFSVKCSPYRFLPRSIAHNFYVFVSAHCQQRHDVIIFYSIHLLGFVHN